MATHTAPEGTIRHTRHLASSFFSSKSKKAEGKPPIDPLTSPRLPKILTKTDGSRPSTEEEVSASPIVVPSSGGASSSKQKSKLAPSNTFNTHYRSISRSMNDLGNIFSISRGRSPPNRDTSPRRPPLSSLPENKRKATGVQESPRMWSVDSGNVPLISIVQHGEAGSKDIVFKEGWLNIVDSHSVRKGLLRDTWKMQHAIISGSNLLLFKPPSHLGIKAFDIATPSEAAPARPQTAPAAASPAFNTPSIRHKSTTRHPDLILDEKGAVKGGTMEALCHEIMFTEDQVFNKGATVTLPAWTTPETGISILIEFSQLKDSANRIGHIVSVLLDSAPGLLLEPGYYNSLRLLIEKGVTPHDPQLAKGLRDKVGDRASQLKQALEPVIYTGDGISPSSSIRCQLSHFYRCRHALGRAYWCYVTDTHGQRVFTNKPRSFCYTAPYVSSQVFISMEPS